MEVFDRLQFDVKQVLDGAVLVLRVAQTIELQIGHTQSCRFGAVREIGILRETDPVGGALY
ncbi:hypothetical protein D3C83_231080 [compost metagenome]